MILMKFTNRQSVNWDNCEVLKTPVYDETAYIVYLKFQGPLISAIDRAPLIKLHRSIMLYKSIRLTTGETNIYGSSGISEVSRTSYFRN